VKRLALGSAIIAAAIALTACSGGVNRYTPSLSPGFAPQAGWLVTPDAGTTIKSIVWGKIPAGTAGKAFPKPVKLTLTAKGSKGKITGAYANPISLTTSDKLKAVTLLINGKPASKTNTVKASTDVITMK